MIQTLAGYINHILSFFYNLAGDYGIAIIMLTVLVNIIMFPLTRKQLESSKRIQEIQPELKRLQEKYKNNKEKYNQVTMEFMKEKKVNPMGGCLPLIIQFPIMIAVFQLLRDPSIIAQTVENFNPYFLFFPLDLTKADPSYILPIMASAATFFQQRLVMTDPSQKMMQYIFPVMIIVISVSLPAGLVLYWFTNSLFSLGNHFLLKKTDATKSDKKSVNKEKGKAEKEVAKIDESSDNKEPAPTKDGEIPQKVEKKQAKEKVVRTTQKKGAPRSKRKTYKGKKKGAGKAR